MTKTIQEMQERLKFLEQRAGVTVNVAQAEGLGFSSCSVKKLAKGDLTFEIKVYGNDLQGACGAVDTAIQQSRRLNSFSLNEKPRDQEGPKKPKD